MLKNSANAKAHYSEKCTGQPEGILLYAMKCNRRTGSLIYFSEEEEKREDSCTPRCSNGTFRQYDNTNYNNYLQGKACRIQNIRKNTIGSDQISRSSWEQTGRTGCNVPRSNLVQLGRGGMLRCNNNQKTL